MVKIEPATTADIPAIIALTGEIWPPTYIPIIGERQVAYMIGLFYSPEALRKQMEEQGHRFIICRADEKPIGFASWSETEPHIFKLHKLYLLPGQQGRGTGRAMLSHIIGELKKEGATALRLNVNRFNFPAKAFYEKTGFQHYKEEDIDIGNGFFMNDHVLQLALT